MADTREGGAMSRRSFIFTSAGAVAAVITGGILPGCGNSSGGGGGSSAPPPPPPGSGGSTPPPPPPSNPQPNTTTVAAAIEAKVGAGNVQRKATSNGNKIIEVNNAGSVVQGEDIVYTVNGNRIDSVSPENQQVQTGDVIDLFDLMNGSRTSIVVS